MLENKELKNIAIIAHVDHGKTTLVDELFKQSGMYRDNQDVPERVMDSMDLERERGITIAAKNCSIMYQDIKINLIDTPGHADFGGEVERSLMMADGAILLVDSAEGPMPQTRFVLQKAIQAGLNMIVVINKMDRTEARASEVVTEIEDLFLELDANEQQLDFPIFYAVGRDGVAKRDWDNDPDEGLKPLIDEIVSFIPSPKYDESEPFQMLVCNIGYSEYTGRLAIGRVFHGMAKKNQSLCFIGESGEPKNIRITKLQTYQGIEINEIDEVKPGEIVILSGAEEIKIGDTICDAANPKALPRIKVDEPTVGMRFMANNSPLAGKEGKHILSTRILERLRKEENFNVAVQVEVDPNSESFLVKGRGEFQLAVLIETMRREDFELCVGRPQILFKTGENGEKLEPIEKLYVECDQEFVGVVTEKLSLRKGKMLSMQPFGEARTRLEFSIPSRGLIGYRSQFLTDTKGTGIMSAVLDGYEPFQGEIPSRTSGSLISDRPGTTVAYGLYYLEDRGKMFVKPGDAIYEGMIVGEHNRDNDLTVNPTRSKKLTNMRAAGKDDHVTLSPIQRLKLEEAIDFIKDDELIEVTPQNIRLRKTYLTANERKQKSKS